MNRNFVGGLLQQTWILERVLLKPDIVCQETSTVCLFFFARLAVEKDIYEMKNRLVLYKGTRGDSCSVGDVSQPQKTRVTGEGKKFKCLAGSTNEQAGKKDMWPAPIRFFSLHVHCIQRREGCVGSLGGR